MSSFGEMILSRNSSCRSIKNLIGELCGPSFGKLVLV